ncbi:MAG: hypothetical protein QM765_31845 [Myxococcales bacterium]
MLFGRGMNNSKYDFLLYVVIVFILFASCVNCACESCQNSGSSSRGSSSLTSSETAAPGQLDVDDRERPESIALVGDRPLRARSIAAAGLLRQSPVAAPRDSILVECAEAQRCPGPHAVFVGAQIDWVVRSAPDVGGASPRGTFAIAEDRPSGVVSLSTHFVDGLGEVVTLRAVEPGTATITFLHRGLGLSTTRQLRVVALEDAVRGEVRLRAGTKGESGRFPADADLVGAEVPSSISTRSPQLVLTWLLKDGTRAVGGADHVSSSAAGGRVVALGRNDRELDDLGRSLFRFFGAPGTVRLSASLGDAKLDQSFDYTYQAPALVPCPAGDTSDFLDAAHASGEGSWPTLTSGLKARAGQDILFPFDPNLTDVTVEQSCGPEQVLSYPQTETFAARFSTPGHYQFVLRDAEGRVVQTGAYGEAMTSTYTVVAGR